MRVSMLDPSLFTGRYDDSLCAALAAEDNEVTLFGRPLRATDAIRPAGYDYAPYFFRRSEGMGGRILKAAEYALEAALRPVAPLAADVVHSQWLPLAPADRVLLARLRRRAALVHTVHNIDAFHGGGGVQGRGYGALLHRFDALIVHGAETRAGLIARGLDDERIHIAPHPPMRLSPADAADVAAVAALAGEGAGPDAGPGSGHIPRILFFGTIRPYKGLDLLVDACLSLWARGMAFELAVAGKPFIDMAFLDRVRAAGQGHRLVADLSFLTEGRLDAHLRAADIIAFPYRHIDSSGALLSALRYGKPLVASDAGMFARLGDAVARFPAGDAAALADTLLPLVERADMRRDFGARALALESGMGSWKESAMLTMAAYRAARARRRGMAA